MATSQLIFIFTAAILWASVSSHPGLNTSGGWESFRNFSGCHTGDHVSGLSSLKKYLYHFGYIPTSPPSSNFSDDFDDAFHTALLTYQQNFNLNTTGILDSLTLDQMVRPRCGVADVINGTSTMNSGRSKNKNERRLYTFFPGTPKWPSSKRELTYAFSTQNLVIQIQVMRTIFRRAFDRWAAVTQLTFTEIDSYITADLRIGFFSGDHGDGEPFDGVLGTLAHAFSPTNGMFHLDAAENWVADGDVTTSSSRSTAIDLESVAVHEIGHLLGLGHSSVEDAIMFPTIAAGTRRVDLGADDILGVQKLYGTNPNFNGTSSSTSEQERDASTNGGTARVLTSGAHVVMLCCFLGWLLLY
ncbi:metalloendoproteinase 2-MMP-like [Magnolia sinica]|uniref:metalloendoproteinase 2-MMP-like n=1 Tax=Magnolia sinica TaxID=86752 RepID=UPI0026587792|nr:metalloendoproteinase 2-MMP-like [Magnolia sinica]